MDKNKMSRLDLQWLSFPILVALLLWCSTLGACNARMYHGGSSGRNRFLGTTSASFNVLDFGGKGDGDKDDTKAFQEAWAKACSTAGSTMLVPSGSTFLLGPISFSGQNCVPNIVFQLEGTVSAPTSSAAWGTGVWNWLEFIQVQGLTIQGKGVIDGRGSVWWNKGEMPGTKPTALRLYGSNKVTVTGIQIINSPLAHLKFDACTEVRVSHISISSPAGSPNTDGIHLQNSQDVVIYNTQIGCGDDCVSIQTGCSGVYIHDVNCGPGHGFSIGGLGNDHTKACVSNITIRDVTLSDTLAGARIKTWQGGSGAVKGALFSNIQVTGVKIPIMIDQFYCDKSTSSQCANETSAVAVSGITFENIRGTYTYQPVHLACSDSVPCDGITLNSIYLTPAQGNELSQSFCWNAYGEVETTSNPPIGCLKANKQSSKTLNSGTESC